MKHFLPPKGHSDRSDMPKLSAEEDSIGSLILTAHFYSNPERPMCPNRDLLQSLAQSKGFFSEELFHEIGIHLKDCHQCARFYRSAKAQYKVSYSRKLLSAPRNIIKVLSHINSATLGRNSGLLVLRFGPSVMVATSLLLSICLIFMLLILKQQSLRSQITSYTSDHMNKDVDTLLSDEPVVKDRRETIHHPQISNDKSKPPSPEPSTNRSNKRATLSFVLMSESTTRGLYKTDEYEGRQTNQIRIPNTESTLRLVCHLPDDSDRGAYDIRILTMVNRVVLKMSGIKSDGKKLVFFCSNRYLTDGNYIVSVLRKGEAPINYEILVKRQKR
jgi:hypothetical protein